MDAKVEPKPGQVWGWADLQPGEHLLVRPEYGKRPGEWVVRVNGRSTDDCCAFYGCETPEDQRGIAKRFIRWATPAECRAAGLDPDAVLPRPERPEWVRVTALPPLGASVSVGGIYRVFEWNVDGMPFVDNDGLGGWWCAKSGERANGSYAAWEPWAAPASAAQAPQNMAQAAIDAYEARIKALEAECSAAAANYGRAMNERDAALRDAAEQRQRAERAEAECAAMRANDMFRRTPAPTQGGPGLDELRAAWLERVAECHAGDGRLQPMYEAARVYIAARERRRGGGA